MKIRVGRLELTDAWDIKLSPGGYNYHCPDMNDVMMRLERILGESIIGIVREDEAYELYFLGEDGYLLTFPDIK